MAPGVEGIAPGVDGMAPGVEGMAPGVEGMAPEAISLRLASPPHRSSGVAATDTSS